MSPDTQRRQDPPSGWYYFGTHAGWDSEDIPDDIEFSDEKDEAGMPLFERRGSDRLNAEDRMKIMHKVLDGVTQKWQYGDWTMLTEIIRDPKTDVQQKIIGSAQAVTEYLRAKANEFKP